MTTSTSGFRSTYALLGLFALMLAGLAVYVFTAGGRKANPQGYLFESFSTLKTKPSDITALEIDKGSERITLERGPDGRWKMTKPVAGRADSDKVEAMINDLLNAQRDDKGVDLSSNLAAHGLDNPPAKITLYKGERHSTLSLGRSTIGGDKAVVYVISSDYPKDPHATKLTRLKNLLKSPTPEGGSTAAMLVDADELRTRKLLGEGLTLEAAPTQLKSVTLTEKLAKGERLVKLVRREGVWRFAEPAGYGEVLTDLPPEKRNPNTVYNLSSLLNAVLSIEVAATKDYLPEARDLSALGLDPNSEGVIRIDLERSDAVGIETLWLSRGNVKKELDKVYARYAGDPAVAQVNAEKERMLAAFLKDPSALRDPQLVNLRRDRVDVVRVAAGKDTFDLWRLAGKWKVIGDGKADNADASKVDDLLARIGQTRNTGGFPKKDEEGGGNNPQAEVSIWEDVGAALLTAKPDDLPKLREVPDVRLVFGRTLEGAVFVRRYLGQNYADFRVPANVQETVTRGRLSYVDIGFPSYDPEKVNRLVFTRGGETWEIERDNTGKVVVDSTWTIVAPESRKGQKANAEQIGTILRSFNENKVEKVVAESPGFQELWDRGLDPKKPLFRLTLGFNDKSPDRTYDIGAAVPNTNDAYAKMSLSNFIFVWPNGVARRKLVTEGQFVPEVEPKKENKEPAEAPKNEEPKKEKVDATDEKDKKPRQ